MQRISVLPFVVYMLIRTRAAPTVPLVAQFRTHTRSVVYIFLRNKFVHIKHNNLFVSESSEHFIRFRVLAGSRVCIYFFMLTLLNCVGEQKCVARVSVFSRDEV